MQTFTFTVFGGVIIFITGQIILKFFIDPSQELKKTLSGVSHTLLFYQSVLTNPSSNEEIASEIKLKSAEILSKSSVLIFYCLAQRIFDLPSRPSILAASKELNLLSHSMRLESKNFENSSAYNAKKTDFAVQNSHALLEIGRLLKIPTTYS
jgi:hypothetical protein